jgi:hypothetical protein
VEYWSGERGRDHASGQVVVVCFPVEKKGKDVQLPSSHGRSSAKVMPPVAAERRHRDFE